MHNTTLFLNWSEQNRKSPDLVYKGGRDSLSVREWKQQNILSSFHYY